MPREYLGQRAALLCAVVVLFAACGGRWEPGEDPHATVFPLTCSHASTPCESCHTGPGLIEAVDPACISCHVQVRPQSHDPETTRNCAECHETACGWDTASPHPSGYSQPELHGQDAILQGAGEGDCRDCHGAELTGGLGDNGFSAARGCDDCHANNDHADWRTDCVFCHGGDEDDSGAPPIDLDGTSDPNALSFAAHTAHVNADGDYRALACTECHAQLYLDALDPGHWWDLPFGTSDGSGDLTAGVAEVDFSGGIAPATTRQANSTCGNNYCHGQGQRPDGVVADDGVAMDCESCHSTAAGGWRNMSGLHEAHLANDDTIACTDCHAPVIARDMSIDGPGRHVNGVRDLGFVDPTITLTDAGTTCTGSCHNVDHVAFGWGHEPDYELPTLHGIDANLRVSNCRACHGTTLTGGVAQGCDDCHATEGAPGWRTDCTFCHGGTDNNTGAPPQDIDNAVAESLISFGAHTEHTGTGTGTIGHPSYGCTECHDEPTDVMTPGHVFDETPGRGEVDLSSGWSWEGGYDPVSSTCSNMYCHGNGMAPSGVIADGDGALDCESCHATNANLDRLSGTHAVHVGTNGITCADCHTPIVNPAGDIVAPNRHVDRVLDIANTLVGRNSEGLCTVVCHDVDHRGYGWSGPHPPGYDAGSVHGPEALLREQQCTSCHGNVLQGGSGQGCDGCHTDNGHSDWRTDCVFCHGGAAGDTEGVPPEDIDGETNEARISFNAHPEHMGTAMTTALTCRTCHNGSQNYSDAFTDSGHWFDSTPTVAEVAFSGIASGTTYASSTCANNYCHGNGQVNKSKADSGTGLTCDGCHSYASNLNQLTGTHALHLAAANVTCADCHSAVVNANGTVTTPARHIDKTVNIDSNATVGWSAASETCTNSCHSHTHSGLSWYGGHGPGYDDPLEHGQDALFMGSTCATSGCHGITLQGGASGQGCDSCHSAGWKSNCTFCHGDSSVSNSGLPPSDLDNTTNESQITFMAHPEHSDGDTHPLWGCDTCHGTASNNYTNAVTDRGHWLDSTAGIAEVSFTGIASGGSYTASTTTCNLYCHGSGISNGSQADSSTGLGCGACHGDPPNTGEHRDHDHNRYTCAECHARTTNTSDAIIGDDIHVDGNIDVDMNGNLNSVSWNGSTCSGSCHGDGHSNERW